MSLSYKPVIDDALNSRSQCKHYSSSSQYFQIFLVNFFPHSPGSNFSMYLILLILTLSLGLAVNHTSKFTAIIAVTNREIHLYIHPYFTL